MSAGRQMQGKLLEWRGLSVCLERCAGWINGREESWEETSMVLVSAHQHSMMGGCSRAPTGQIRRALQIYKFLCLLLFQSPRQMLRKASRHFHDFESQTSARDLSHQTIYMLAPVRCIFNISSYLPLRRFLGHEWCIAWVMGGNESWGLWQRGRWAQSGQVGDLFYRLGQKGIQCQCRREEEAAR